MQTKSFISSISTIRKSADQINAHLHEVCRAAIIASYKGDNEMLDIVLALPLTYAKHAKSYMRRVGRINFDLSVPAPFDVKHQAKVFESIKTYTDIVPVEFIEKTPKAKKEPTGEVRPRVQKKMESTIESLKKSDPEAGSMLNSIWTNPLVHMELTAEEIKAVTAFITARRMRELNAQKAA